MKKITHILTTILFTAFLAWSLNATAQTYSITVVQPNGGESWGVGTTHLISWSDNLTKPVKIELLRADTLYRIITSSTSGTTYAWAIPDSSEYAGTDFKVQISSTVINTINSKSTNVFTITSSPTAGTIHIVQPDSSGISWGTGTTHLISWRGFLSSSPVKIELMRHDATATPAIDTIYRTIKSSTTGSSFIWAIPDSSEYVGTNFKVRITSVADSTISDTSTNMFTMTSSPTAGTIHIVQPDKSGISWGTGTTHLISWRGFLSSSPVKIELLRGATDTLYRTIKSSTTGSTFTWAIPDSSEYVGTTFKVRITSVADSTISDTSTNMFTMTSSPTAGTIHIVQPDSTGISWGTGTTHLISWRGFLSSSPVKIELLRGATDTLYRTIISSTTGSTYAWAIPDSSGYVGTNFKVRITSIADTTVSDTSTNMFTMTSSPTAGTIHIVQPDKSGISWGTGTTHLISWRGFLSSSPVKIELMRHDATATPAIDTIYRTIVDSTTGSTYAWTIPDDTAYVGTNFKVRITSMADTTISDTSTYAFAMTSSPTAGTIYIVQPDSSGISWAKGTTHLISWRGFLSSSPVKIELMRHDATVTPAIDTIYRTIIDSTTGSTYAWTIPDDTAYVGTNFKVRITSIADTTVSDTSANMFTITSSPTAGAIHIVQPDSSGISWVKGSAHLISWRGFLSSSPVKIELMRHDATATPAIDTLYRTIVDSTTGSTYAWTIPDDTAYVGTNFKVRVTSVADTAISDTSANTFTITAYSTAGTIYIVQPDSSGISWVKGSAHLISWRGFLSSSPVKIELMRHDATVSPAIDTLYRTITDSTTGSTYAWTIPDDTAYVGTNFKVRITSTVDTAISDTSANTFTITATPAGRMISIIQPDKSGISWLKGTAHLISWTDNLAANSPVKIELMRHDATVTPAIDTLYRTIIDSTTGSTYAWTIPDDTAYVGTNFKVRILSKADTTVSDTSANMFTITAVPTGRVIHIVQPDSTGISWVKGSAHLISWTDNLAANSPVRIELLRHDATVTPAIDTLYRTIIDSTTGSTYAWTIPDDTAYVGTNFKVRILSKADTTVSDTSANTFTITATPTGRVISIVQPDKSGISWLKGTAHLISWTDNLAADSPVKIELMRHDATATPAKDTIYRILKSSTNGSTYTWTIPDDTAYVGTNFKVRILSIDDTTVSDTSANMFTITAVPTGRVINIVQPDTTGISWVKGSAHLISWTDNLAADSPVKIELMRHDATATPAQDTIYRIIKSSTNGSTYAWTIPDDTAYVGTNFKVRILSIADTTVSDTSAHMFTIAAVPTGRVINIVQPDTTGISWLKGTAHLISWTSNLAADSPVKIELLRHDATATPAKDTIYRIIKSSTNGSTYTWTIPDDTAYVGTNFKVRILSIADTTVSDTSAHMFTITAVPTGRVIHIEQPDTTGLSWAIGSSQLISWTSNLAANSPVKIELLKGPTSTLYRIIKSSTTGSSYTWTIPDDAAYVGTDFRVRILSVADTTVSDTSNNVFAITQQAKIDVYPNPSTTHVTVKFSNKDNENYTLILYNRFNMRVMLRRINTAYMKEIRINTFDLPSGIYFLRLTSGKQVISRKIIVQH